MNTSYKSVLLAAVLAASASLANAQLISRSFNVTGSSTNVVAHFDLWINLNTNTLVLDINNALSAASNANVGTITGIGFNTPFAIASQTNDNPGTVAFKAKWTVGSAQNLANGIWSNDDYWDESTPFALMPYYNQDYGVSAPTPNYGIEYGEKTTFVFQFSQDINLANCEGFFDNNPLTTNRFDLSVRWQEVTSKTNYVSNCTDGSGSDKGGFDIIPSPEQDIPPTPEPSTYGLIGGAALLGLVLYKKHKTKQA